MGGPIASIQVRWRPLDATGEWVYAPPLGPDARSITITGVTEGVQYRIEARSVGPSGLKSIWIDISHTVGGISVPDVPTLALLNIVDGVQLSWTFPRTQKAGVEVEIERATSLGSGGNFVEVAQAKGFSTLVVEFTAGTFYYRARSINFNGQFSIWSNIVEGLPIPSSQPPKVLTIVSGAVEINCDYDQFTLALTENASASFVNVRQTDTIIIAVTQSAPDGAHTLTFPVNVQAISGVSYIPSVAIGSVDILGLNTSSNGVTWWLVAQKPVTIGPGTGTDALAISITPSPASASTNTDGVTPSAPSVQVTTAVSGGIGLVTHNWSRADTGGTDFLISNAAIADPVFSIPSGTTAYPATTQQWRDTVADSDTPPRSVQAIVAITLTRINTSGLVGVSLSPDPARDWAFTTYGVNATAFAIVTATRNGLVGPFTQSWLRLSGDVDIGFEWVASSDSCYFSFENDRNSLRSGTYQHTTTDLGNGNVTYTDTVFVEFEIMDNR